MKKSGTIVVVSLVAVVAAAALLVDALRTDYRVEPEAVQSISIYEYVRKQGLLKTRVYRLTERQAMNYVLDGLNNARKKLSGPSKAVLRGFVEVRLMDGTTRVFMLSGDRVVNKHCRLGVSVDHVFFVAEASADNVQVYEGWYGPHSSGKPIAASEQRPGDEKRRKENVPE